MPGFKDFVNGTALPETDLDDYLGKQVVMKFASAAARDAALGGVLREGMVAYLDDLNTVTVYSGAAWSTIGPVHGALPAWTPTITQSASVTSTITYARYTRNGRLITGWFNINITSAGTITNAVIIGGIPFTAAAMVGTALGSGELFDASVPAKAGFNVFMETTTTISLRHQGSLSQADNRLGITGTSFAAALASGDTLSGYFSYEAAADA